MEEQTQIRVFKKTAKWLTNEAKRQNAKKDKRQRESIATVLDKIVEEAK